MSGFLSPAWASGSLDSPPEGLKAFEDSFAVHLIATPRAVFRTCAANENLAGVVERNRSDNFDFLPVTDPESERNGRSNRIIGLVESRPLSRSDCKSERLGSRSHVASVGGEPNRR
jgi:hypothetical protein